MSTQRSGHLLPTLALIAVTAVWGSTFFMIKDLVNTIPPLDFLGVRFLIAGAVFGAWRARSLISVGSQVWKRGTILGLIYACAQVAQTIGLQHTDASVSGFITGMYVVLTPLVLLVAFKVRVPAATWIAIALATIGLSVLSLHGLAFGFGESLTLLGSLFYAIHIVLLGRWAATDTGLDLAAIQVIVVGVACMIAAVPSGIVVPHTPIPWAQMLYMAIFAAMGALLLQTWAQARIPATNAAIIMTTEPLFAALFAVLFGGEHLTVRLIVGGGLILAAMFVTELVPLGKPRTTQSPTTSVKGERS